tara:strand:+ start:13722 stop:14294 length:573 start_codon:yes stop_codon:yes gene_type:complete
MTTELNSAGITRFYLAAAGRMRELPWFNPALRVEVVGWQALPDGTKAPEHCHWFGIVITPWSLLLWAKPAPHITLEKGSDWGLTLPAGECILTSAWAEETGPYASTSLLSDTTDIRTQDDARTIAEEILQQLLQPADAGHKTLSQQSKNQPPQHNAQPASDTDEQQADPVQPDSPMLSRRGFLTGLRTGR